MQVDRIQEQSLLVQTNPMINEKSRMQSEKALRLALKQAKSDFESMED